MTCNVSSSAAHLSVCVKRSSSLWYVEHASWNGKPRRAQCKSRPSSQTQPLPSACRQRGGLGLFLLPTPTPAAAITFFYAATDSRPIDTIVKDYLARLSRSVRHLDADLVEKPRIADGLLFATADACCVERQLWLFALTGQGSAQAVRERGPETSWRRKQTAQEEARWFIEAAGCRSWSWIAAAAAPGTQLAEAGRQAVEAAAPRRSLKRARPARTRASRASLHGGPALAARRQLRAVGSPRRVGQKREPRRAARRRGWASW